MTPSHYAMSSIKKKNKYLERLRKIDYDSLKAGENKIIKMVNKNIKTDPMITIDHELKKDFVSLLGAKKLEKGEVFERDPYPDLDKQNLQFEFQSDGNKYVIDFDLKEPEDEKKRIDKLIEQRRKKFNKIDSVSEQIRTKQYSVACHFNNVLRKDEGIEF
ncbi:MAG: hypothetical protein MJ252_17115 [archaeon]|nr:hypothetical protein [archaeon]